MCGNRAQDATKSHTRSEDAQDAQDANWTSLASGCKADVSDVPYVFADVELILVLLDRFNGFPYLIPGSQNITAVETANIPID